jgi:hypothetical protein
MMDTCCTTVVVIIAALLFALYRNTQTIAKLQVTNQNQQATVQN